MAEGDLPAQAVASKLLAKLLARGAGLEIIRVHTFRDDEAAHGDDRLCALYREFLVDLDHAVDDLAADLGPPVKAGNTDHGLIPLCGVFRFALWQAKEGMVFLAAAHEDRGCPMLLALGLTARNSTEEFAST